MSGKKSKNWFQKLQPGKLIAPIVERFIPGGENIVGAYRNVEGAIKRTVKRSPVREYSFEGAARGVPVSQVAAERARRPVDSPSSAAMPEVEPAAGVPWLLLAGAGVGAYFLLRGRR